ncbi:alpha/beta fold hydrolase [Aliishimia ponticola]|uniref:Alpha/beta fold hydrolase n=1 Tax=Aliishimia ponticola TaxID=2499833 RepID=A0A4S4N7W1_9RHOB|nr:alpha/beta fold hydrolase [Aliishimia ponticola]THH34635.1 alpha/beta fold hydrolase [Aliishimia ponticola]
MLRFLLVFVLLLSACADRIESPIVPEAADIGSNRRIYVATNREQTPEGFYGIGRSNELKLLRLLVSIPPERKIGTISDGQKKPDPVKDFTLARQARFDSEVSFREALRADIAKAPDQEATVYVHGFNNSFADPAFRLAQLSYDLEIPSALVTFSWPSRGNPFGYQYDIDSAFYSRDALARLLKTVKAAGSKRITLIAHSMGSALTMETLRTIEISEPGWAARNLAGVILISPDVNVDLFREQTRQFKEWPQPFVVFSSQRDKALLLSGRIRGDNRQLGKLTDLSEVEDLPVTFIDVSDFVDGTDHFVAGSSASFISLIGGARDAGIDFLSGTDDASIPLFGSSRVIGSARRVDFNPVQGAMRFVGK